MRKGDGDMKEKKRVWFTFNLCEADAFEQMTVDVNEAAARAGF